MQVIHDIERRIEYLKGLQEGLHYLSKSAEARESLATRLDRMAMELDTLLRCKL